MRDTIFISHATPEDNDFTIWLASRLQMLGYKVWIDKTALIGGEKFWEEIDQTIRNKAVKVLLIYSKNICQKDEAGNPVAGKLKDGIYKEYSLAESIAKQDNISDFIILVNNDGINYNMFIGADRLNQIPFYENWADGLKQLQKKLVKDKVINSPEIASTDFTEWFQSQYIAPNPIIEKKELYYSNILPITRLPDSFYIHQFRSEAEAKLLLQQHKQYPLFRIANHVSCFEADLLYNVSGENTVTVTPEKIYEIGIREVLMGYEGDKFPTHRDSENYLKSLLKQTFHQIMKNRGMFWYEMSNKKLAYFYTPANLQSLKVKFEFPFRKGPKAKTKNLIGVYKKIWKWHYAISVKPILSPILGFSLKSHLTFTKDGFEVWRNDKKQIDTDKIQSHRRSKGKTFFNEEWRDMFLAFLHGLKKENKIEISLSAGFNLELDPFPEMFWSDRGYYDPKDKTRQGLLSSYNDDQDNDEGNDNLNNAEDVERT